MTQVCLCVSFIIDTGRINLEMKHWAILVLCCIKRSSRNAAKEVSWYCFVFRSAMWSLKKYSNGVNKQLGLNKSRASTPSVDAYAYWDLLHMKNCLYRYVETFWLIYDGVFIMNAICGHKVLNTAWVVYCVVLISSHLMNIVTSTFAIIEANL